MEVSLCASLFLFRSSEANFQINSVRFQNKDGSHGYEQVTMFVYICSEHLLLSSMHSLILERLLPLPATCTCTSTRRTHMRLPLGVWPLVFQESYAGGSSYINVTENCPGQSFSTVQSSSPDGFAVPVDLANLLSAGMLASLSSR